MPRKTPLYFSQDFSREVGFSPLCTGDFSLGENPAKSRGKTEYITFSRGAMQGPGSITHRPPSAAPGAPAPLPNLVTLKPTVSSRQSPRPGSRVPAAALRTGQQRGPRQVAKGRPTVHPGLAGHSGKQLCKLQW